MSQATTSSSIFSADYALGSKVIGYALQALGWGISLALAWACSSFVMGLIVFIIMSIVMALLMLAAQILLQLKLSTPSVESIGSAVGGAAARFTGLFSRKVPA